MLLMEVAAGQTPNPAEAALEKAATDMLAKNGIADPAGTLSCIRDMALQLEKASPQLANDVRHSMAILQEAKSEFVAKLHGWFDQTIDRVADRFTQTARVWTFVAALAIAVCVQLDTFALVNRLSVDDQFRAAIDKNAKALLDESAKSQAASDNTNNSSGTTAPKDGSASATPSASPAATASATPTMPTAPSPASAPVPNATASGGEKKAAVTASTKSAKTASTNPAEKKTTPAASATASPQTAASTPPKDSSTVQKDYYNLLSTAGLVTLPGEHWFERWDWSKFPGILFSALLLSLGAPFWYKSLQDLLRLRSSLAQKDEQQRNTRQTTQSAEGGSDDSGGKQVAAAMPAALQGEQGDLKAVG